VGAVVGTVGAVVGDVGTGVGGAGDGDVVGTSVGLEVARQLVILTGSGVNPSSHTHI
jgi:hypothetical protein